MPELRKDYATDTWVVFAPVRSKRPMGVASGGRRTDPASCPFCPGHEPMTPPEVYVDGGEDPEEGPRWSVRCVPNLYPALEPMGDVRHEESSFYRRVSGVGVHEVVVETPDHDGDLGTLHEAQLRRVVRAYRVRSLALGRDPRTQYVLIFRNHGERAGATITHPHSQIMALPIVPQRILEEMQGIERYASEAGSCIYCHIAERELAEGRRVIFSDREFLVFSPFAARFPFETWILPRAHQARFEDLDDAACNGLARAMREALGRLHGILNDPDYNSYVHTAPRRAARSAYHWHIEITPRMTELAGFERGTGFFINPVMPEDAASILRGQVGAGERRG